MNDLEQLTSAANEALSLLDINPAEAAGVLQAAVDDHGYRKAATAVPRNPAKVGVCSSCEGDVIRTPGRGAECPCGFIMIPEHFRQAVASGA